MPLIPNVAEPYPDELLYSWICRLAKVNALGLVTFKQSYLENEMYSLSVLQSDVRTGFVPFIQSLDMDEQMKEIYLSLTTFQFESIFLEQGRQTRYINNVFRPKDKLNTGVRKLFGETRACPECIKEDIENFGEPYLHRSHQLSGVCMCYKHKSPLIVFHGSDNHEMKFCKSDYKKINSVHKPEDDIFYAKYANELLEASISANAFDLKRIVYDKIKKYGYGPEDNYLGFINDFNTWEHNGLWEKGDLNKFLRTTMLNPINLYAGDALIILMFLFQNVKELIQALNRQEDAVRQYRCPKCKKIYCATPASVKDGWGCPYCESKIPETQRFKSIVETMNDGEYELLSDFDTLKKKMVFSHKKCGRVSEMNISHFLFRGGQCMCKSTITKEQAEATINAIEGFKLIDFKNTKEHMTILHEDCGREFKTFYHGFIQHQECRHCVPDKYTPESYREYVKDLVGDEYTIVKDYVNHDTKVAIRHNVCGCVEEYRPSVFTNGKRCTKCTVAISLEELQKMLNDYSDNRYEIKERISTSTVIIFDKETNKTLRMYSRKVIQEMMRPTPSQILHGHSLAGKISAQSYWSKIYDLLCEYKNEYGTANVPSRTKYKGYSLGFWCQGQRSKWKKGLLEEEQEKLFHDIGFAFDIYEERWMEHYKKYKKYIKETGLTHVPCNSEFDGECLKNWLKTQRKQEKEGKLSEKRKQLLLELNPNIFNRDKSGGYPLY